MRETITIKIKKVHPDAIVPHYASDGAACFDLHAVGCRHGTTIDHNNPVVFRTGLSFEIPPGWVMKIYSRSGHGFNFGTRLGNAVGVIDSDYRGEVMVKLTRDLDVKGFLHVSPGDRIAQAMLVPIPRVEFGVVDELSDTVRGAGGFGSTGQGSLADHDWKSTPLLPRTQSG